jgi:VanZ family protein
MKTARWMAGKISRASFRGKISTLAAFGISGIPSNEIDPEFFNQVAQMAHFGMMYFVMTMCCLLGHSLLHKWWVGIVIGVVLNLSYATWHEFFWDPVHENPATRGSDIEDFAWLVAGGTAGVLVYFFLILGN